MGTEWLSEEELDAVLDEAMLGGTVYKMAAELREWRTNASRVRRARTLNDESTSQGSAANIEELTVAQIEAAAEAVQALQG